MNNSVASSLTAARFIRERLETIVQSLPGFSSQLEGMDGIIPPSVAAATTVLLTDKKARKDQGRLRCYEANCDKEASPLNTQQNQTNYNSYCSRVPAAPIKQQHARAGDFTSPAILKMVSSAKEPTFPVKLHMILSNPEFEDVITWLPHGRSWTIHNHKAFEERVIPLYFRHGRFASFARQVNGWGFRRVTQGSDYNSYYHEMFLRCMPHLCAKMKRLTVKDTAARKTLQDTPTPNFYALSCENPLPDDDKDFKSTGSIVPAFVEPEVTRSNFHQQQQQQQQQQPTERTYLDDLETLALANRCCGVVELGKLLGLGSGQEGIGGNTFFLNHLSHQQDLYMMQNGFLNSLLLNANPSALF